MTKIYPYGYCLLTMIFLVSFAYGESKGIQNFLLKEPVSVMDFGLYKIKTHLDKIEVKGIKQIVFHAGYNAELNKVQIDALAYSLSESYSKESKKEAESLCQSVIYSTKEYLTIDIKTGKPIFSSCMQAFFGKSGVETPLSLFMEMDKITVISVTLYVNRNEFMKCESPLINN